MENYKNPEWVQLIWLMTRNVIYLEWFNLINKSWRINYIQIYWCQEQKSLGNIEYHLNEFSEHSANIQHSENFEFFCRVFSQFGWICCEWMSCKKYIKHFCYSMYSKWNIHLMRPIKFGILFIMVKWLKALKDYAKNAQYSSNF